MTFSFQITAGLSNYLFLSQRKYSPGFNKNAFLIKLLTAKRVPTNPQCKCKNDRDNSN